MLAERRVGRRCFIGTLFPFPLPFPPLPPFLFTLFFFSFFFFCPIVVRDSTIQDTCTLHAHAHAHAHVHVHVHVHVSLLETNSSLTFSGVALTVRSETVLFQLDFVRNSFNKFTLNSLKPYVETGGSEWRARAGLLWILCVSGLGGAAET